jgi:hypothetical protein
MNTIMPSRILNDLDVEKYGFFGINEMKTVWMDQILESLALNISASFVGNGDGEFYGYGYNWTDSATGRSPFRNMTDILYAAGDRPYPRAYVESAGVCSAVNGSIGGLEMVSPWGTIVAFFRC